MKNIVATLSALAAAVLMLVLTGPAVTAWDAPCDFLTGGGFIITTASGTHDPAKANFAIGGGCKHGSPTWGHLNYIDHGNRLHVHWTSITAYLAEGDGLGDTVIDPKTGQPLGTRIICGTARTNQLGDVDFMVRVRDAGEPGVADQFDLRLSQGGAIVYTTENEPDVPHELNDGAGGGGNIQLHKPNPSTTGTLGGDCPARDAV
jgi:hypothetical protein